MEYVIPTLAVVIGIMLLVLVANARRLHRSGLAMREDIDRIRRQAPQAPGPPAVAGVTSATSTR